MKKINRFTFDFNIEPKDYRETITAVTFGIQRWKRIGIFCVWVVMAVLFLLNLLKVIRCGSCVCHNADWNDKIYKTIQIR